MIRTRDFFLYFLILFFLFLVIATTIKIVPDGVEGSSWGNFTEPLFGEEAEDILVDESVEIDRQNNLKRLREKLAEGEGIISQGEPVLTSVDTPTSSPTDNTRIDESDIVVNSQRNVQWCPSVQNHPGILAGVIPGSARFISTQTERQLFGQIYETVVAGSTTEEVLEDKIFLRLPLNPVRDPNPNCLDSDVVGVATDGRLIKNQDVWQFRHLNHNNLVGYARDGFPIYGSGIEESALDSCGGYDNGSFYAYYLRESEPFVLACFAGEAKSLLD